MEDLQRVDPLTFKEQKKFPIKVILDNVRSLHNVGSTFRTADAFAVEQIVICGITGTPPHRDIEKTALGATQSVDWIYAKETKNAVQKLKADGYKIYVVEQVNNSIALQDSYSNPEDKIALIFGNEVNGVQDSVIELADASIEIPQYGTKHSLNVSVSIGIVLWHFVNQSKDREK